MGKHFDNSEVNYFLNNVSCFCNIRKGYDDDHPDRLHNQNEKRWVVRQEIENVKGVDGVLLLGLIKQYPGKIKVCEDDYNGQTFVEQLQRMDIPNVTFELHNKAIDGVGDYKWIMGLPWPSNSPSPDFVPPSRNNTPKPIAQEPKNAGSFLSRLANFWGCCRNAD